MAELSVPCPARHDGPVTGGAGGPTPDADLGEGAPEQRATAAAAAGVRRAFEDAGYLADPVAELLGPVAAAALARDQLVPAERATRDGSPLATLVRLFLLGLVVPRRQAEAALPLAAGTELGLVGLDGDEVRAALDVRPYGSDGWWVVSDLGTGLVGAPRRALRADHVLGVGAATATLAGLLVPAAAPEGAAALDLGTGSGALALSLAAGGARVTGTDVNPRALRLAGLTAALSGTAFDLVEGSLYEPVEGRRFAAVVSNPPFVVSPQLRFAYRDSGLPGDELCRRVVAGAPGVLEVGGWCQLLANWLHVRGEDWRERVGGWLPPGCAAWVVQREVMDPAAYAEAWLRDTGDVDGAGYPDLLGGWLDYLDEQRVDGIGMGWVALRRTDADETPVLEEWPFPVAAHLGPEIAATLARREWLRRDDAALRSARLRLAGDVTQEQHGRPGAEHPDTIVLRRAGGLRRAREVGTAEAALAGACDAGLPLDALLAAVAEVTGESADLLPAVRALVADGFLEPAED